MNLSFAALNTSIQNAVARYYRWLVAAVCLFSLVIGWFLFLEKQYITIRDSGLVDLQTANTELTKREQQLIQIERMERAFAEIQTEQLNQLSALLPSGVDEIVLMESMQRFAEASQAMILSIDVSLAGSASTVVSTEAQGAGSTESNVLVNHPQVGIAYIVLNLQPTDTSYTGFKTFLSTLETFTPVLNLKQISYTPATTSYALQLETYYQLESMQ